MALSVNDVVSQFDRMLSSDGSSLSLVEVIGSRAKVSYGKAGGEACESCVMEPDDLREMLAEALARHKTGVTEVELVA